jgi:hypothetical protein
MEPKVYFSKEFLEILKQNTKITRLPSVLELAMRNLEFFEEDGKKMVRIKCK